MGLIPIFKSLIQIDKKLQVNLSTNSINGHCERMAIVKETKKVYIIIKGHIYSDHKICVPKDQYMAKSPV